MVRMGRTGVDNNVGMINHNDWHRTLLGGHEKIMIEANGNNPPTVKQNSRFCFYAEHSDYTILDVPTQNNVYPQNTAPTYIDPHAVYEPADAVFVWNTTVRAQVIPTVSDGVWYLYCLGAEDINATSRGKGLYNVSKTETPTYSDAKGGYYSANGYRILASFTVATSVVSLIEIYEPYMNRRRVITTTVNYTATLQDEYINCNGTLTLSLPAASTAYGVVYKIKNIHASLIATIDPNSSETINGLTTLNLNPNQSVEIYCNGTSWQTVNKSLRKGSLSKAVDYTITDFDNVDILRFTASGIAVLPLAANNTDREIEIVHEITSGLVTISPTSPNKINLKGTDLTSSFFLFSTGDRCIFRSNGTKWIVEKADVSYATGGINWNDNIYVKYGMAIIPYDGEVGTPAIAGETFVEETSGNTGYLFFRSATNLYVLNVTGTGYFTNNKKITWSGNAGRYVLVNTATATKNINSAIFHNLGVDINKFKIKIYFNTSSSMTGAYCMGGEGSSSDGFYVQQYEIDTASFELMQGNGISFLNTSDCQVDTLSTTEIYVFIFFEIKV
jgi:hypothetical protein